MTAVERHDRAFATSKNIQREYRALGISKTGANAGFGYALTKQEEYARGTMSNKPISPGGESFVIVDNEEKKEEQNYQQKLLENEVEQ
ncbi:dead deah box rna [Plasmopara halstedii]|uniref:Dead deah box rna n=1 Tax=Plasmopara halstedii TaxID=4781 RepID=A0A0P1AKR4_PLAHL|nr:dead deah box rna [Plasmopara halstedii]CEG41229.1 dead deah box rna [Plasmopara halstedii]|eukprot:XP_024577598.1 dead deah box rna [Plasmopara halstedii]